MVYIGLPVLSLCRDNILIASFFLQQIIQQGIIRTLIRLQSTQTETQVGHILALRMVKFLVLGYIHSTTVINFIQPIYLQGIYHYYFSLVLQNLSETLYRVVPEKQKEVADFRKEYGDRSLGEYTVDQVHFTLHVIIVTIASSFALRFYHHYLLRKV